MRVRGGSALRRMAHHVLSAPPSEARETPSEMIAHDVALRRTKWAIDESLRTAAARATKSRWTTTTDWLTVASLERPENRRQGAWHARSDHQRRRPGDASNVAAADRFTRLFRRVLWKRAGIACPAYAWRFGGFLLKGIPKIVTLPTVFISLTQAS